MKPVLLIATALMLAAVFGCALYLVFGRPALPIPGALNRRPDRSPLPPSDLGGVPLTDSGELKLMEGGEVEYRFNAIADSGVLLVRQDSAGKELWRAICEPLGVSHSKYRHQVEVQREGERLRVTSRGSFGTFVELLELASGKQIERSVGNP